MSKMDIDNIANIVAELVEQELKNGKKLTDQSGTVLRTGCPYNCYIDCFDN